MLFELVLWPAADAFLEVTVYVAAMMGAFGLLQWRLGPALPRFLSRYRRFGPILGAVLGVVPGCGGAIMLMPLFARRQVSFGAVVAALVATMGDSSFVLIAADPRLALHLHGLLFVTGLVTGWLVDAVGYAPSSRSVSEPAMSSVGAGTPVGGSGVATHRPPPAGAVAADHAGPDGPTRPSDAGALLVFWLVVALGLTVAIPDLLHGKDPAAPPGPFDAVAAIGLVGTGVALWLARSHARSRRCCSPAGRSGLVVVLADTGSEAARVGMWITVVFVGLELAAEFGLSVVLLASVTGLLGVVAGAMLGLIPGCGPQVVLTGLFASGVLPFSTLVANALSQDGDALLPLLLLSRRAAIVANFLTTLPGLAVGAVVLAAGFGPDPRPIG